MIPNPCASGLFTATPAPATVSAESLPATLQASRLAAHGPHTAARALNSLPWFPWQSLRFATPWPGSGSQPQQPPQCGFPPPRHPPTSVCHSLSLPRTWPPAVLSSCRFVVDTRSDSPVAISASSSFPGKWDSSFDRVTTNLREHTGSPQSWNWGEPGGTQLVLLSWRQILKVRDNGGHFPFHCQGSV